MRGRGINLDHGHPRRAGVIRGRSVAFIFAPQAPHDAVACGPLCMAGESVTVAEEREEREECGALAAALPRFARADLAQAC